MRNILKYPVTTQEIVECLTKLSDEILDEGRMGDMRPLLLTMAARYLIENQPKEWRL